MFYERFLQLCKVNYERPTVVLKNIGVSSGNLRNWKKGTCAKAEVLILLSDYFNVSVDYLLGRDKPNTENTNSDNDIIIDDSTDIGVSSKKQYDETANQVAEMFSNMNIRDKAKVLSFMIELSEK